MVWPALLYCKNEPLFPSDMNGRILFDIESSMNHSVEWRPSIKHETTVSLHVLVSKYIWVSDICSGETKQRNLDFAWLRVILQDFKFMVCITIDQITCKCLYVV